MEKVWNSNSIFEEEEEAPANRSFGGVTATDFFGLLLVSMFTLTLLAALTLGLQGDFEIQTEVSTGGQLTAMDGVEARVSYRELTVESLMIGQRELEPPPQIQLFSDGDVTASREITKASPTPLPLVVEGTDDVPIEYIHRSLRIWEWVQQSNDAFLSSGNQQVLLTIPPAAKTSTDIRSTAAFRAIRDLIMERKRRPSRRLRQLVYAWGRADYRAIAAQLDGANLSEQDVQQALRQLALIHVRSNYGGLLQSTYFLHTRFTAPDVVIHLEINPKSGELSLEGSDAM